MNTKGIKFLAVLTVMVMAFAAIVALAPADKDVDAIQVYGEGTTVVVDPTDPIVYVGDDDEYYISDDAVVKIRALEGTIDGEVTFYVQNGKELELSIKGDFDGLIVNIYSVTGDQQRYTTSTVYVGGEDKSDYGKIVIKETLASFVIEDEGVNQSVVYTAMMPYTVITETTSGSNITTDVWTYDPYATTASKKASTQQYATIASDAVLYDAEILSYVTVAPGQYIQTSGVVGMTNYGIMTQLDEDDGCVTYYAVGMNAGGIVVAENGDIVKVQNGSATVSTFDNSSNVKLTSAKGVVVSLVNDVFTVSNLKATTGMTAGTMTVSGDVAFSSFIDNATVTLNANAIATGSVQVKKTLILKNTAKGIKDLTVTGSGTIIAQNEKLWDYGEETEPTTDPVLTFANDGFEGQFDVYAITKVAEVKDAFSTAIIKKNQTFIVVADTVVTTALDVEGVLIIQPGVTLTITKTATIGAAVTTWGQYAQIINYGDILIQTTAPAAGKVSGLHVHGGLLQNDGKIIASSNADALAAENPVPTFEVKFMANPEDAKQKGFGAGFDNQGTVTVSRNDFIALDANFVNNGSVSVNGILATNGLQNAGVFTLNNAKIVSDGLAVSMTKSGAVFTIGSAEFASAKTITVQNQPNSDKTEYANYVKVTGATFTSEGKSVIRNVTVTDNASYGLALSGTFASSAPNDASANAKIATKGSINVYDAVTVGKGIDLDFTANTYMYVAGTFTAKDSGMHADVAGLTMDVPGKAVVTADFEGANYLAAMYADGDYRVFTNLENAVPGAVEAEESLINVGGVVYVYDDIVVPEGMTIIGTDNYASLVVDGMATITVQEDAMVSINTIVVKDGMILAEDVNNISINTIKADVKQVDSESTAAACMSLNVALMLATPGDVIELSQEFYASDVDLVIPAGVTVDATAAEDPTDFVLVNSNLVVDGVLVVDNFKFIATTDDTIGITVNGYIYDSCINTSWKNGCFAGWWYTPFGVSYYVTDEDNDKTWYVLTTIENIQPAINVADDAKVTVEGHAVLDELTVTGRDDMPAEVTFREDVDIGVINIDEVTLIFKDGKEINTTVRNAVGSITLTGAYVDGSMSIYDMAIYSTEAVGVYMEGAVTDGGSAYGILFEGVTGMDGTDTRTDIGWTNDEAPAIIFDGVTTVIGKKVYIQFDDEYGATGMATITGTLLADNNSKIVINSDVQVLGGLVAAERTEDTVAGAIEINGDLFVGTLESDIYSQMDALNAYEEDAAYAKYKEAEDPRYGDALMVAPVGDGAIVSGNVEVAKGFFITVMNGSVIDPQIIEDLEYLDIVIEDTLWLTVYGYGDTPYSMDGLKAPIVNAKVTAILDANGNPVAKYNHDFKVVYGSEPAKNLSAYGEGVLFVLDYDVFNVVIKTDGSVKAVYIDGILMYTGENRNTFTLDKIATGTHKVTVEAATGYDASKCVLYTEMGTILPGMAFTFTEYDCDNYSVTYNINGTEIQPEPVPPTPEEESQWTVTTILLVILVVLIAIMAVIVALRLNRS